MYQKVGLALVAVSIVAPSLQAKQVQKSSASQQFLEMQFFLHLGPKDLSTQLDPEMPSRGWTRCKQGAASGDSCWSYSAPDGGVILWGQGSKGSGRGGVMLSLTPSNQLPFDAAVLAALIARAVKVEAQGDKLVLSLSSETTKVGITISSSLTVLMPSGALTTSSMLFNWSDALQSP